MLLCDAGGAPRRLQYRSVAGSRAASRSRTSACADCDTNNSCLAGAIPPLVMTAILVWPQCFRRMILHGIIFELTKNPMIIRCTASWCLHLLCLCRLALLQGLLATAVPMAFMPFGIPAMVAGQHVSRDSVPVHAGASACAGAGACPALALSSRCPCGDCSACGDQCDSACPCTVACPTPALTPTLALSSSCPGRDCSARGHQWDISFAWGCGGWLRHGGWQMLGASISGRPHVGRKVLPQLALVVVLHQTMVSVMLSG